MNKRRLLKLADLLEADAKNPKGIKFDLEPIARRTDGEAFQPDDMPRLDCGTTACALGLWAISGAFKRQGVSFRIDDRIGDRGFGNFWPLYDGCSGRHAAEAFFEIDGTESYWLFIDDSYPEANRKGKRGELAVAKRIRNFVAGRIHP